MSISTVISYYNYWVDEYLVDDEGSFDLNYMMYFRVAVVGWNFYI